MGDSSVPWGQVSRLRVTVERPAGTCTVSLCDSRAPQGQEQCLCMTVEHHGDRYRVFV